MCGRYRRTTREEELSRIYGIPIPSQPDLPISYNIAPSQEVLAIRFNPETKRRGGTIGQMIMMSPRVQGQMNQIKNIK
jgi:putative SOS response-associated peptidase YedK